VDGASSLGRSARDLIGASTGPGNGGTYVLARRRAVPGTCDDLQMRRWCFRALTALAAAVVLLGALTGAVHGEPLLVALAVLSSAAPLGAAVILARRPEAAVAPALAWSSASVVLVLLNDTVAASAGTSNPLPGSSVATHWWVGDWPLNVAGVLALLLVFPHGSGGTGGSGRSRRLQAWARVVPWLFAVGTGLVIAGMWDVAQDAGRVVEQPGVTPGAGLLVGLALVTTSLVSAVADVVLRYRRANEVRRRQLHWLVLAGTVVVALLACGWAMQQIWDVPLAASYLPFLVAILVLVPAAVAIAVVRHDLVDVDHLLGASLSWLVSLVVSAALFALLASLIAVADPSLDRAGAAVAAFVAALVLLPLHRLIGAAIVRVVDPARTRAHALADRFIAELGRGERPPEDVGAVLREICADSPPRLLLHDLDGAGWSHPDGSPARTAPGPSIDVRRGDVVLARVEVERWTPRSRRRVVHAVRLLSPAIEMCRLGAALQRATAAAQATTVRLAEASAVERRRLERDLHDGAQMRIIATALRLRAVQPMLDGEPATEVDRAVAELRDTAEELRRVAHGIRPSRLDDGLAAALVSLRSTAPVPVHVEIDALPPLGETQAITAYFVAAEAVTNALKHARPREVHVTVTHRGDRLVLAVSDDGCGLPAGTRPPALVDRLASVGGTLELASSAAGTTITAVIPCAS